jgi:foldase protein PrsA
MKYVRSHKPDHSSTRGRRLKTKPVLIIMGILFVSNLIWFFAWMLTDKYEHAGEAVAKIEGKVITREQWLAEMENEIGRETLHSLVNEAVMEAAAKKYKIHVTDKEIDLELALIHSVDPHYLTGLDEKAARQKIRSNLILEKVLTKDMIIDESAIQVSYDENASLYHLSTAFRTAIIVLPSRKEAEQVLDELSQGSTFDVLAKERSIDRVSSSLGGDIGYINENTGNVDSAIIDAVIKMGEKTTSSIISLGTGNFAVVRVQDILQGQSFTYDEVKDAIRRELAIQQLPQPVNPEAFWKEFDAKWIYGK